MRRILFILFPRMQIDSTFFFHEKISNLGKIDLKKFPLSRKFNITLQTWNHQNTKDLPSDLKGKLLTFFLRNFDKPKDSSSGSFQDIWAKEFYFKRFLLFNHVPTNLPNWKGIFDLSFQRGLFQLWNELHLK